MSGRGQEARDAALDLVKAGAIVFVLLIHASSGAFWEPLGSSGWYAALLWSGLARGAVPLFLMCSGALFLPPERPLTLRRLYGRYQVRILAALIFWACLYKLLELARSGPVDGRALLAGVRQLLRLEDEGHLYYLRIMLVFYAFLPVGRLLVRHAARRQLEYLLALWILLGILAPTVAGNWPNAPVAVPPQWPLNTTYTALGYGLLGYYLTAYPLRRPAVGLLLFLAGALWTVGVTAWASLRQGALYSGFLEGKTLGPFLMAFGLFGLARCCRPGPRLRRAAATLSRASFCVYLSHMAFLHGFLDLGWTVRAFTPWAAIPLTAAAALGCSFLLWQVLRRIPVVRSYLI